jgi:DNA polymerase III sliding clamp (beta) subunit (PCNA family)
MIINAPDLKKLLRSVAAKGDVLLDSKLGTITSISPELTISARTGNFVSRNPFVLVTDGRKLSAVVARMSGEIAIHLDDAALVLKAGRAEVKLETKPARAFNQVPAKDTIVLPLSDIKPLLQYVSVAADKNRAGEYGGGIVKMKAGGCKIEAAATDGARLALTSVPFKYADKFDYVLPLPAVAAILNLEGDTVEVSETDSYLYFSAGNVSLSAAKLAKEFVDYSSYLPKSFAVKYQVDADMFKNALLTVKPLVSDQGEPGIAVHFLDNLVTVTDLAGAAIDQADYVQLEPDENFQPTPASIKVNIDHLLSFFANISGPVTISANGPRSPIWLEAGNKQMLLAVLAG